MRVDLRVLYSLLRSIGRLRVVWGLGHLRSRAIGLADFILGNVLAPLPILLILTGVSVLCWSLCPGR